MLLTIFLIWLTGAIGMFILDGYLDFEFDGLIKDELYGVVLFALSIWWLELPLYLINKMRNAAKKARLNRQEKAKELQKIRIAAQRETEEAMIELEEGSKISRQL